MKKWIKNNWKSVLKKIFYPHDALIVILVIASTVALIYSLGFKDANPIVAYVSYFVSAYALTIFVLRMPPIIRGIKKKLYENEYSGRYLTEPELRARISLYTGFVINVLYAGLKFGAGIYFRSVWLGAIAVYYIILSIMRLGLVRKDKNR